MRKAVFGVWLGHDSVRVEGIVPLGRHETVGELKNVRVAVTGCTRANLKWKKAPPPRSEGRNVFPKVSVGVPSSLPPPKRSHSCNAELDKYCQHSWVKVKHLLEDSVALDQPCASFTIMVFLDAFNFCWGAMETQGSDADL